MSRYTETTIRGSEGSDFYDCIPTPRFRLFQYDLNWHPESIVLDRLLEPSSVYNGKPATRTVEEGALPDGEAVWVLSYEDRHGDTRKFFIDKERFLIRRNELHSPRAPRVMLEEIAYEVVETDHPLTDESITFELPATAALWAALVSKPLSWLGGHFERFERVVVKHALVSMVVIFAVMFAIGYALVRWAPARFLGLKVAFVIGWIAYPVLSVFTYEGMIFAVMMLPLVIPIPPALIWTSLGIVLARSIEESEKARRRLSTAGGIMFVVCLVLLGAMMIGGVHM